MKKFFGALTLCLACASFANADIVFTDSFDYADGNLVGNGSWVNHSGTGDFIQVVDGQAVFSHGGGSREDASVVLDTYTSGLLKATFDVVVTDDAFGTGTDFEYFAHFFDSGDSNFRSRVDIQSSDSGDYTFGISESSTAEATLSQAFSFGETVTLMMQFDFEAGASSLMVGSETIATTSGAAGETLNAFALRQSNSSNDETISIDNLQIEFTAIPEPASAVIFGLAGLGLCVVRRRS